MTRLFNDPADFADEAIEGFVAAHRRWVRQVPGGVVRRAPVRAGQVAVVIGGGSGHYPAFAGLVGEGLAAGAVMGNVFASPSAAQVTAVAAAAQTGGGVLLTYGNYAGDTLNFGDAEERLRERGVPCRTVVVTDDISSAPADQRASRRGIAGDLVVFKIAAAAAAAGDTLSEVAAAAELANERTRTIGVAFGGCTLPGAPEPLFSVPAGRMAIGLGIHGEPGLDEVDVPSADGLAEEFVSRLLAELPAGLDPAGARAVVVLNGLGSVKYEELFVVYRRVGQLLQTAGVSVVDSVVGEVCTSFDMAGASLTICWVDDRLRDLWLAPADAPAFRMGSVTGTATDDHPYADAVDVSSVQTADDAVTAVLPATAESRHAAATVVAAFAAVQACVDAHVDELGRIDAVAGDGDHGIGMQRGSTAAAAAAQEAQTAGAGAGTVITLAGEAWADRAGGTSGALWGLALRRLGSAIGDQARPDAATVAAGVHAGRMAICEVGGAELGDKTLVDVLIPFDLRLSDEVAAGASLVQAWRAAVEDAAIAAAATAQLLPRRGRARPHAEKSLGTPDAGAVSLSLIVRAVLEVLDPLTDRRPSPAKLVPTAL